MMGQIFFKRNKILFVVFFVFFLFTPSLVLGGLVPCGGPGQPACEFCHLFEIIGIIVNSIVWRLAPAIATIMIIYSGIMFFTALGDPGKLKKAKDVIMGTVIGFLIIVLAWAIVVALYAAMGATITPIDWWNIPGCP